MITVTIICLQSLDAFTTACYTSFVPVKRISLQTKLSVFASLLVLIVVLGAGVGLYLAERQYLEQRIQESQVEMVEVLTQVAKEALAQKSDLLLSSYLSLIRRSRSLSYAMVVDPQGRILAHSNVVLVGQKADDELTMNAQKSTSLLRQTAPAANDSLIDLSLPIYFEGQRIGTTRVGYSQTLTDELVDQALAAARGRILLSAVASLILGILGAYLLAHFITRPIQHLRDGAKEIGDGALDHRLPITSTDELGDLALEFNIMAEKLQELDRLKQDFVSNVTHELRSPLTSLRGYVEFLLRGDAGNLTDEQSENLIVVKNNAARLAKFIDTLLDVAKIEARKVEIHPEAVSLQQMGKEMSVLFRPQAQEKNISFRLEIPPNTPPVWADADKLSEILTNLLSNAFKFTPNDGTVTLKAVHEFENIHLSVQDSGVGIPTDSLEKVFNKFEQVKPTDGLVRKTKGTGLGLTIVKGYVDAHDGKVWIQSKADAGTAVHVVLPAAKNSEEDHFVDQADENASSA